MDNFEKYLDVKFALVEKQYNNLENRIGSLAKTIKDDMITSKEFVSFAKNIGGCIEDVEKDVIENTKRSERHEERLRFIETRLALVENELKIVKWAGITLTSLVTGLLVEQVISRIF